MTPSAAGRALTQRFESCRLTAYPDPGTGGAPWTIGWGHTVGVRPGMVITQEQADLWFDQDHDLAGEIVSSYVVRPLTQSQFDAVTDFVYNVGRGMQGVRDGFVWLKNGNHSTILNLLNAGNYEAAALEFPKWNLPHLPGIIARRLAEQQLFRSVDIPAATPSKGTA